MDHLKTVEGIQSIAISSMKIIVMLSRFNHVWPFATLWTTAWQAPLSMGFSRQKYWSVLPFPPPVTIKPSYVCAKSLQLYSCLENPMDRGACQAMVHRVAKSQIQLKLLMYYRPKMKFNYKGRMFIKQSASEIYVSFSNK